MHAYECKYTTVQRKINYERLYTSFVNESFTCMCVATLPGGSGIRLLYIVQL